MPKFELQRTKQCAKCPWKVSTDPHDIPDGYDEEKHLALAETIAIPGALTGAIVGGGLHVMACHETEDAHCVGWLYNQLGRGNNIALRIQMLSCTNVGELELDGEQHETFNDTLP